MRKNPSIIIAIVACLLCAMCLFQIVSLKQEVQNLRSSVNSITSDMQNSISGIYSNIDSKLEEQASLVAESGWSFGEADIAKRTVPLLCTVSPKEFRPGVTAATLFCNGSGYPMTLASGAFTVSLSIGLFEESHVAKVQFEEGGTVRTESLNWYLTPRHEYLPYVYANFSGSGRGAAKEGVFVWSREGQVEIFVERKGMPTDVRSIDLLVFIDGQETERTSIPLNTAPSAQSAGTIYMEPTTPSGEASSVEPTHFYYPLNRAFPIPFGSTFELYVEVTDGDGLHYRALLDRMTVSSNGQPVDDGAGGSYGDAMIYDAAGVELYRG